MRIYTHVHTHTHHTLTYTPHVCSQALEIATNVKEAVAKYGKNSVVNMSFVAYRDWVKTGVYDPPGSVQCCDFTPDIGALQNFVAQQIACGGGDGPEDICGGLHKASQLNWTSKAKYIFIIADCPCHGSNYHNLTDSFPHGDPLGMVPEKQLEDLMRPDGKYGTRGIQVTFVRVTAQTDKMVTVWNQHLKSTIDKEVKSLDLSHSAGDLAGDFSEKIKDEIVQDWIGHHF